MGDVAAGRSVTKAVVVSLFISVAMLLSACQHVSEPWTVHGKQYKLEHFKSDVNNKQLDHRIQYTQIDR